MRIPNAVKELLILFVSVNVSPSAPEIARRSLPAKSTKWILPIRISAFEDPSVPLGATKRLST